MASRHQTSPMSRACHPGMAFGCLPDRCLVPWTSRTCRFSIGDGRLPPDATWGLGGDRLSLFRGLLTRSREVHAATFTVSLASSERCRHLLAGLPDQVRGQRIRLIGRARSQVEVVEPTDSHLAAERAARNVLTARPAPKPTRKQPAQGVLAIVVRPAQSPLESQRSRVSRW